MRCLLLALLLIAQSASGIGESLTFRGKGKSSDGRVFSSRLVVTIGERAEGLPIDYRLQFVDGNTEQIKIKLLPPAEDGEQHVGEVEVSGNIVGSWSGGPDTDAETMNIEFSDGDTETVIVLKFRENYDEETGEHLSIPFVIRALVNKQSAEATISWQDTLQIDFTSVFG